MEMTNVIQVAQERNEINRCPAHLSLSNCFIDEVNKSQ